MRCTALTALFFAFFALFSTMAYAAPVAPQGAIFKRQCLPGYCKNAEGAPAGSGSTRNNRFALISKMIIDLLSLMDNGNNTPSTDPQPTPTMVTAAQSSSVAPASNPTGV